MKTGQGTHAKWFPRQPCSSRKITINKYMVKYHTLVSC